MSTYPLRLYRAPGPDSVVVNNGDEEDAATDNGYKSEKPSVVEFPKAMYLHPVDKAMEHKVFTVGNQAEQDEAMAQGYKVEPHVPVAPSDKQFEETAYEGNPEAQGSGSEKYGASDWTAAGQDVDGYPVPKGSPEDINVHEPEYAEQAKEHKEANE